MKGNIGLRINILHYGSSKGGKYEVYCMVLQSNLFILNFLASVETVQMAKHGSSKSQSEYSDLPKDYPAI